MKKFSRYIFTALIIIYTVLAVASGYWYWMRPVRRDQIRGAHWWWTKIAVEYNLPIPKNERWPE